MSAEMPKLNKTRVWSQQLRGYTYGNVTLSKCQHYPMCKEGKKEMAEHRLRLAEVANDDK